MAKEGRVEDGSLRARPQRPTKPYEPPQASACGLGGVAPPTALAVGGAVVSEDESRKMPFSTRPQERPL